MLNEDEEELKLIDFGLAKQTNNVIYECAGTREYYSPEDLAKKSGLKSDIWSLGIILYKMVCGTRPFDGKTDQILFGKIQTGDYKKTGKYLNLSTECKDLISQVFTIDPDQRINGQQALDHPWFAEFQLGRQL